jgi:hypothetical protein
MARNETERVQQLRRTLSLTAEQVKGRRFYASYDKEWREEDLWAAWQAQVAASVKTPGLLPEVMRGRSELFPHFTAYYAQLWALPRRVRRALQRQWQQPLAALALWLALGQSPVQAATIPVGDSCTLAAAIAAAITDTATGGCPAGSGADTIVLPAGSTHILTSANNRTYGATGLPVISSAITIEGKGSTIARATHAPAFRLFAVSRTGELTLKETTVSGGVVRTGSPPFNNGGGMANFGGTLTVLNSTIAGNSVDVFLYYGGNSGGGGVYNRGGTLTIANSTISGNSAERGGGGGVKNSSGTAVVLNSTIAGNAIGSHHSGGGVYNRDGTLIVLNSTISGNNVSCGFGGGVLNTGTLTVLNSTIVGNNVSCGFGAVYNSGTLTLARTLVSGNYGEILNSYDGTVFANNHNLFGVDGNAGVGGFSPGATDIVPPAGVLLPDILNPTLAHHGGPTQTHALVPGSPALDAAGPVCLDANGSPLLTDQRGKPRLVDGNGDGTAACDIGAFEFFPVVNAFVTLAPDLDTAFDPTPVPDGPAGTFTITATFTNTSDTPLRSPFFTVTELSGGHLLLNADEGARGVGTTLTPDVGDRVLAPGEAVPVDFVIGLQARVRFTFFVDLFGEPVR